MKRKNINKKGFTLIELLAVIVILAIITVLATRTLLPLFSDAGRDGVAINANEVRNVSADLMSLYTFSKETLKSSDIKDSLATLVNSRGTATESTASACICISDLKSEGLIEISNEYHGKVVITNKGNGYNYAVTMDNGEYYVSGVSGNVTKNNAVSTKPTGYDIKCSTTRTCA